MTGTRPFEIFLATIPGLETVLCDEVRLKGFKRPVAVPGGVTIMGVAGGLAGQSLDPWSRPGSGAD